MIVTRISKLAVAAVTAVAALGIAGCAPASDAADSAATDQSTTAQTQSADQGATSTADSTVPATPARTPDEELADPADLVIVDSGWFESDKGMVDFAVEVQNSNATMEAVAPVVHAVAKDADGNVVFEDDIDAPSVLPSSCYYYSMVTGTNSSLSEDSDNADAPVASMEFTVETPDDAWQQTDVTVGDIYTVTDNGAADSEFNGVKEFTGTVTASQTVEGSDSTRVDVILFADDGSIEGGFFKIVDATPNQATDYDVYAVGAPDFASYEVYASPWMGQE